MSRSDPARWDDLKRALKPHLLRTPGEEQSSTRTAAEPASDMLPQILSGSRINRIIHLKLRCTHLSDTKTAERSTDFVREKYIQEARNALTELYGYAPGRSFSMEAMDEISAYSFDMCKINRLSLYDLICLASMLFDKCGSGTSNQDGGSPAGEGDKGKRNGHSAENSEEAATDGQEAGRFSAAYAQKELRAGGRDNRADRYSYINKEVVKNAISLYLSVTRSWRLFSSPRTLIEPYSIGYFLMWTDQLHLLAVLSTPHSLDKNPAERATFQRLLHVLDVYYHLCEKMSEVVEDYQ